MAFFCTKTGVRIVKPGVSKSVDAETGHDEVVENDDGVEEIVRVKAPKAKPDGDPKPKADPKAKPDGDPKPKAEPDANAKPSQPSPASPPAGKPDNK